MADDGLNIYDEIEIEDMTFDAATQLYTFPCPCGDRFEICIDDLRDGEEIAVCPSCSLMIRVIFDLVRVFDVGVKAYKLLTFSTCSPIFLRRMSRLRRLLLCRRERRRESSFLVAFALESYIEPG